MTDLWVNYLALQPNVDGSYSMRFYVRPAGSGKTAFPRRITTWFGASTTGVALNSGIRQDMSTSTTRRSSEITAISASGTATGTVRGDVLINDGIGARLLAGGNVVLRITGQLLNDASVMTANGNLMQDGGGNVDNRGYSIKA